jgi:hypothetical protein
MNLNSAGALSLLSSRYGSADWNKWQIIRWSYYDYIRYPVAGTTQLNFFQNALGATDPTSSLAKTYEDTNVQKTGTFGQVYFIAAEVRTHIKYATKSRQPTGISDNASLVAGTLADATSKIFEFTRRGVLNWSIGQKDYYDIERPFQAAPPGFGLIVTNVATNRPTPNILPFQSPHRKDVFELSPPQVIEPEQTFAINIKFDTTGPVLTSLVSSANLAVNIGVLLDGYIARPSQ